MSPILEVEKEFTPEEKAISIFNSFYLDLYEYLEEIQITIIAKKCSITHVKMLIEELEMFDNLYASERREFMNNVLKAIENYESL